MFFFGEGKGGACHLYGRTTFVRTMNRLADTCDVFLTIEQVCQASGFTNADTFTRNFRAKFGMTPTAYRGNLG